MAPCSVDGDLYAAIIRRTWEEEDGENVAEVRFQGYSSDDNEIVKLSYLKALSKNARSTCMRQNSEEFTSPLLNYISEAERIRVQYADMYSDPVPKAKSTLRPSPIQANRSRSKATARSRKCKGTVALGGAVKNIPQSKSNRDGKYTGQNSHKHSPGINESTVNVCVDVDCRDFPGLEEGFSLINVEKPSFPSKSGVGSKEPLVLSAPGQEPIIQVPGTINRYLRDYQREGVQFLYGHYKKGRGAILGDDMGLGKTVQVIALISALLGRTGGKEDLERRLPEFLQRESPEKGSAMKPKVFLIICPNSVLYNWLDEFETWTHCLVARYHGKERDETLRRAQRSRLDAVITTFETYRLYLDDLLTVQWDAVFADEVHKIKEPGALITKALKRVNTRRRFGLSGTALQNKMAELWCVLDWANPGCLGGWKEFKEEYEKVISAGQRYNANKRELADARQVAKQFSRIRSKWMIRRNKALIAHQLPTKDENVVFCNLSNLQLAVYRALLESPDMTLILRQKEPCDCGREAKRGECCYKCNKFGEGIKSLTFGLMSLLIKVSNHIALLLPDSTTSEKQRAKAQHYCDIAFAKDQHFVELSREARFATLSDPSYCGKMQVLEKLLAVFKRENNKVLLFSSYTQLLDILEMYLKTTYYTYRRLDGKTSPQDRQKFVQEFNKEPDIFLFLISTKAGGIGLNLTGANVVVIFDPNWNPTHDLQAQDRAYRIGQHRDVRVYRLVSRGSIEENMYLRQVYKQQLASVAVTTENAKRYFTAVAGDKERQGEIFGLRNLFALRVDGSLTKDVIQREEKTELGITLAKYKPVASVDEREEEAMDEEDEIASHCEQESDDDFDIHGMASEIDDISSRSSGHSSSDEGSGFRQRRPGHKPNMCHVISSSESKCDNISAYEEETDRSGNESEQLARRRMRGKALVGRDGRPVCRTKGHPSGRNNVGGMGWPAAERKQNRAAEGTSGQSATLCKDSRDITTVDEVFKKCGVTYIHSNQKVIGGSHIEDHVSEVAVKDVFERGQYSQEPAYCQVPKLAVESSEDESKSHASVKGKRRSAVKRGPSEAASFRLDDTILLLGQTPPAVKREQLKEMASMLEYKGPLALSHHIQTLSDKDCCQLLLIYHKKKYGVSFEKYIQLPKLPGNMIKRSREDSTIQKGKNASGSASLKSRKGHRKSKIRCQTKVQRRHGRRFDSKHSNSSDSERSVVSNDVEGAFGESCRKNTRRTSGQENLATIGRKNGSKLSSNVCNKELEYKPLPQWQYPTSSRGMNGGTSSRKCHRPPSGSTPTRDLLVHDPAPKRTSEKHKRNSEADKVTIGDEMHSEDLQRSPSRKWENSLSFLDDIFLTSSTAAKRKPPPIKKAKAQHWEQVVQTPYNESEVGIPAGVISDNLTMDHSEDGCPKVKHLNSSWAPAVSAMFPKDHRWLDCDAKSPTGDEVGLWKRNTTFAPQETYLPEAEGSDDSQSLFVVNTNSQDSCKKMEFT